MVEGINVRHQVRSLPAAYHVVSFLEDLQATPIPLVPSSVLRWAEVGQRNAGSPSVIGPL